MRKQILNEIDRLLVNNCHSCEKFNDKGLRHTQFCKVKCPVGIRLIKLGEQLSGPRNKKVDRILDKGKEMTTDEIVYLLQRGVTRKVIAKRIRIDSNNSAKFFRSILEKAKAQ